MRFETVFIFRPSRETTRANKKNFCEVADIARLQSGEGCSLIPSCESVCQRSCYRCLSRKKFVDFHCASNYCPPDQSMSDRPLECFSSSRTPKYSVTHFLVTEIFRLNDSRTIARRKPEMFLLDPSFRNERFFQSIS
jgi:hypothetical protein